jgi:hypothetical protein
MSFVELNRYFVAISKDEEPHLEFLRFWERKAPGWLDWSDLRGYQRVALLAEASSGKSAEFRNQAEKLVAEGHTAFCLRIEELADQGFEAALNGKAAKIFKQWRDGTTEGLFFLDSVDEARLNRKSFETALKRFSRELDQSLERAQVFISCRVTDWKGPEDRALIESLLPAWERPERISSETDEYSALLDPIFKPKSRDSTSWNAEAKQEPSKLLVVQIVPLSTEQCRILAGALGVTDVESFIAAINRSGLDAFTERPGDVIDLVDYWKSYGRFDSFAAMVEHSITQKLKETDTYRADNDTLTLDKARRGAERLAAALTLGKSFTLRAPAYQSDPSLASGALDPQLILNDWTEAERNALLRRGVFAPSTYGRIRFHHRATQEYLTAQWLHRLLESNCSRSEVWDLIFANRYGIETIVPSLRPVAAWLALRQPDFIAEIIKREPLVLLQHGDPGAVPIEHKKQLLLTYAKKHTAGEIADDSLDRRVLWMFADNALADAIREAWRLNGRADFRSDLLRIVREGKLVACVDLARTVALDDSANEYHRIVATEALKSCDDQDGLANVARLLIKERSKATPHLAAAFAKALFPRYLGTQDLLDVIKDSQSAREHTVGGFPQVLVDLYDLCPDQISRRQFVGSVAELCLAPPLESKHHRVSARHSELAKNLEPVAKRDLESLGENGVPDALVRLLMVIERADRAYRSQENWPTLCALVQSNVRLQRKLFWADVAEQQKNITSTNEIIRFWQIGFSISPLWQFRLEDLTWLYDDLTCRPAEADQRIALSAIVAVLRVAEQLQQRTRELQELVKERPALNQDLETYLAPQAEDPQDIQWRQENITHNQRAAEQKEENKLSWIKFKTDLQNNPNQLRDPQSLSGRGAGMFRLWWLTEWLQRHTGVSDHRALREWRLLEEGFGRDIAEAFRDGMMVLWRNTEPERPTRKKGGGFTVKFSTILSFGAIGMESVENPDWNLRLTDDEATRAAHHGTLSEQGYPEWIDALITSHSHVVLPEIERTISKEWPSAKAVRSEFLSRYASPACSIPSSVQEILFRRFVASAPRATGTLDRVLRIVRNLDLDEIQKNELVRAAKRRFSRHAAVGRNDYALRYLALMLVLDINRTTDDLASWIKSANGADRQARTEATLAFLFDRHDPVVSGALDLATVPSLERLLRLAYSYIRPEQDIRHEGVYSPGLRDNAESSRNLILKAVLDRPGVDAFRALIRIAEEPEFEICAERFKELARGKAERDTEPPAWREAEVVSFEQRHTAPAKIGIDLLRVVMAVLQDIQLQLSSGDVSSRSLLEHALDEEAVKNWLVEQMNLRARGRFNSYREAQIAHGNKPDVIVSSTSAQCEVGIEVKHGGKKWTLKQLDKALRQQLAQDYLKPLTRRHGIFVITNHRRRTWLNAQLNESITFDCLMRILEATAATLVKNDIGAIEVKCFGVNASPAVGKKSGAST